MSFSKPTLSVIVITKNEADRIARCLSSVSGIADEIIVVDSGSTDDTVAIARRFTDQVTVTDWPGYGPQKQRALEMATGTWVLSIDADEALSPELMREIPKTLAKDPPEVMFRLPWATMMFGRQLKYGRSGRAIRRLFRREGARFSDARVHETVITPPGPESRLKGRLIHYAVRDFNHLMTKNRKYAWLKSQQKFEKAKKASVWGAGFRSAWVFFQIYVLRGGILDGSAGFLMAVMYSQYTFNKYAGLWSLNQQRSPD